MSTWVGKSSDASLVKEKQSREVHDSPRRYGSGLNCEAVIGTSDRTQYAAPSTKTESPPPVGGPRSAGTHGSSTTLSSPGAMVRLRGASRRPPSIVTTAGTSCGFASATAKGNASSSWLFASVTGVYSQPR